MRIAVVTVHESWSDTKPTFRLCEQDGTICDCWLPGLEPSDPDGALDRGGFDQRLDADAFRLGIDYERALFGLIAESVADIDREREQLDSFKRVPGAPLEIHGTNSRKTLDDLAGDALDRMDAAPQLDFNALLGAVGAPAATVVTHRRRVA